MGRVETGVHGLNSVECFSLDGSASTVRGNEGWNGTDLEGYK